MSARLGVVSIPAPPSPAPETSSDGVAAAPLSSQLQEQLRAGARLMLAMESQVERLERLLDELAARERRLAALCERLEAGAQDS